MSNFFSPHSSSCFLFYEEYKLFSIFGFSREEFEPYNGFSSSQAKLWLAKDEQPERKDEPRRRKKMENKFYVFEVMNKRNKLSAYLVKIWAFFFIFFFGAFLLQKRKRNVNIWLKAEKAVCRPKCTTDWKIIWDLSQNSMFFMITKKRKNFRSSSKNIRRAQRSQVCEQPK
jgi:hypothetical protein